MDKLPQRKQVRIKDYDYSQAGYYFITICVKDKKNILCNVGVAAHGDPQNGSYNVGVAAHGDPQNGSYNVGVVAHGDPQNGSSNVGVVAHGDPQIRITQTGEMVLQYLENIGKVYENVTLDCLSSCRIMFIVSLHYRMDFHRLITGRRCRLTGRRGRRPLQLYL